MLLREHEPSRVASGGPRRAVRDGNLMIPGVPLERRPGRWEWKLHGIDSGKILVNRLRNRNPLRLYKTPPLARGSCELAVAAGTCISRGGVALGEVVGLAVVHATCSHVFGMCSVGGVIHLGAHFMWCDLV